jgi:putative two-component system response regulator
MNVIQTRPILFLDDERLYLEMMTLLLSEHLSCLIAPFTRPADALAALPRLDPGIIITDFSMPEMNGIDFLYRVRAIGSTARAIMITGHQIELGWQDLSHVPGLRATLFKPVGWRELAEQIIQHWPDQNPPGLKADPAEAGADLPPLAGSTAG